jgi:hypothetical protein
LSPPCSIYSKSRSTRTEIRRTFIATVDKAQGTPSILCFENKTIGTNILPVREYSRSLSNHSSVLALESIQTNISAAADKSAYELLVAHQDGSFYCLPSDLGDPLWETNLSSVGSSIGLEHVLLTTAKEVKEGLLGQREDIAAQLLSLAGSNSQKLSSIPLIIAIENPSANSLWVSIFAIRPQHMLQLGFEQPLQPLTKYKMFLPEPQTGAESLEYSWNVQAGLLHVKHENAVFSFCFATGLPKHRSTITNGESPILSHRAVSSSLILAQSGTYLTLYDTNYSSIQDRQLLTTLDLGMTKKRKRTANTSDVGTVKFVAYFAKLGMALAIQGHNIIATQLGAKARAKKHSSKSSRLLNSLSKGIDVYSAPNINTDYQLGKSLFEHQDGSWSERRAKFIEFVDIGDVESFDQHFATEVGLQSEAATAGPHPRWIWTSSKRNVAEYRTKALFALRCIFEFSPPPITRTTKSEGPRLSINFFPPNTFQWLMASGQLSTTLIEQAFLHYPHEHSTIPLRKQDLFSAIAQLDSSLEVLSSVVSHATHLDIGDVVQCIKYIVQSFDTSAVLPAPNALLVPGDELLTNGVPSRSFLEWKPSTDKYLTFRIVPEYKKKGKKSRKGKINGHQQLANSDTFPEVLPNGITPREDLPNGVTPHDDLPYGDTSYDDLTNGVLTNGVIPNGVDHETESEVEAAIAHLDMVLRDLDDGHPIRGEALSRCLKILDRHSTVAIIKALGNGLAQRELLFLSHLLRIELARGGWLTKYSETGMEHEDNPYNAAVGAVTRLIDCTLHAIGTEGNIAASDLETTSAIEQLVTALQIEQCAGSQNLDDIRMAKHCFEAFLSYSRRRKQPTAYHSTWTGDRSIKLLTPLKNELPLAIKVEEISLTRTTSGGQTINRSKRDLGRQKSKKVPKWSRERIRP